MIKAYIYLPAVVWTNFRTKKMMIHKYCRNGMVVIFLYFQLQAVPFVQGQPLWVLVVLPSDVGTGTMMLVGVNRSDTGAATAMETTS